MKTLQSTGQGDTGVWILGWVVGFPTGLAIGSIVTIAILGWKFGI